METLAFKFIKVTMQPDIMGTPVKYPVYKINSTEGKKAHLGTVVYDDTYSSFMFIPSELFFFLPQHMEEILQLMKHLKEEMNQAKNSNKK